MYVLILQAYKITFVFHNIKMALIKYLQVDHEKSRSIQVMRENRYVTR